MLGGFQPLDGTIEFFCRLRAALKSTDVLVDLGAGRGAWFFEDRCDARRHLRDLRPLVSRVIGLDVDPVVLDNRTTSENRVIVGDRLPLDNQSIDVIIADYVLEHVQNVDAFVREIDRVLKPGGYVFARTPHKYMYVSIAARLVHNNDHTKVLAKAQPKRLAQDVFPTAYRLNTLREIAQHFRHYQNYSYLYAAEPGYHFGSRTMYAVWSALHRIAPRAVVSNVFVFLRKN